MFSRGIFRISPNLDEGVRQNKDFVHHPLRNILLCHNAFGLKKHRSYVPTHYAALPPRSNRTQCTCICGRHSCDVRKEGNTNFRLGGDIQQYTKIQRFSSSDFTGVLQTSPLCRPHMHVHCIRFDRGGNAA